MFNKCNTTTTTKVYKSLSFVSPRYWKKGQGKGVLGSMSRGRAPFKGFPFPTTPGMDGPGEDPGPVLAVAPHV